MTYVLISLIRDFFRAVDKLYATLLLKNDFNLKAISKILGHSKEIVTADNYIDNQELIADGVEELREYMSEVLPQKPSNYSEKEKLFDCTDINISDVFESLIA